MSSSGETSTLLPTLQRRERLRRLLAAARIGTTFNQYADSQLPSRDRLERYLDEHAARADPARRRGARLSRHARSGIPLTSERQLTGAGRPRRPPRSSTGRSPSSGSTDDVLLWNVVPTHPGRRALEPAADAAEIEPSAAVRRPSSRGDAAVIAVGRVAHARSAAPYVRHPSHGGAAAFRHGLDAALCIGYAAMEQYPDPPQHDPARGDAACLSGMVQLAVARRHGHARPRDRVRGHPRARPRDLPDRRRARGAPGRAADGPLRADPGARRRLRLAAIAGCRRHGARLLARLGAARGPRLRARRRLAAGSILLARAAAADMFPPERRARGISLRPLRRPLRRDPRPARLPARSSPARSSTPDALVVPWLARVAASCSSASCSSCSSGPTRRRSPQSSHFDSAAPSGDAGAARARSSAARAS